jgi:hypothetical protein
MQLVEIWNQATAAAIQQPYPESLTIQQLSVPQWLYSYSMDAMDLTINSPPSNARDGLFGLFFNVLILPITISKHGNSFRFDGTTVITTQDVSNSDTQSSVSYND